MFFNIYGNRIDLPEKQAIVRKISETFIDQFIDAAIRSGWYNISAVEQDEEDEIFEILHGTHETHEEY